MKRAKTTLNVSAPAHAPFQLSCFASYVHSRDGPDGVKPSGSSGRNLRVYQTHAHVRAPAVCCIYLLTANRYKYTLRTLMVISHSGVSISSELTAPFVRAKARRATSAQPAEGRTSEFEVSSNVRLSKTQLKKLLPPRRGRTAPPCPARRGPLTERMNAMEGLFPAEQAKGRTGDKRPPDSAKRT